MKITDPKLLSEYETLKTHFEERLRSSPDYQRLNEADKTDLLNGCADLAEQEFIALHPECE